MITTSRDEPETLSEKPGSGVAVSVRSISKVYRIWSTPAARLTGSLLEIGKRLLWPRRRKTVGATKESGSRSYRNFHALKDISFDLKQGESLGIIGLNGSGKSTLLQIIAGTLQSSKGEVKVSGRIAALLELGSGFSPEFTGKENVYLNASLLGLSKKIIDSKYQDIVAFSDIGEFIDQPVKTYS
ncbi:MAG: ATP-binding cassette domain-containing protein, partial [Opitutales bacterium]